MPPPDRVRLNRLLDEAVAAGQFRLRSTPMTEREVLAEVRLAHRHLAEAEWFVRIDHPILESPFARAYDAVVVAANALLAAYGYTAAGEGGHEQALRAAAGLLHALGEQDAERALLEVRDTVRPLRHAAQYEHDEAVDQAVLARGMELARRLVPVLTDEALARRELERPDFGTFGLS